MIEKKRERESDIGQSLNLEIGVTSQSIFAMKGLRLGFFLRSLPFQYFRPLPLAGLDSPWLSTFNLAY
jgi:hypothetical protein